MNGPDLAGCRILLVEDEFLIAFEITDALSEAGAEVCGPYATLAAAEEAASTENAEAAILDIDLKGEEVFPAARKLRQRGIPFIFYTGQPERETLRSEFADVPVYVKPCAASRLVGALSRLLAVAA